MEAVEVRGRFVWHELMTRNVPGARDFYSKLIGWKTIPWPLDPAYTVCHGDSGPVAGITNMPADLPAEVPSHWMQYIGTRDVDSVADAAVRAGGSIVKAPGDMPGAGRYAVLQDPQGAVFAIIDPENARPESDGFPPIGCFSWHELATTDHEAAFAFYSGLFGWDAMQRVDMGAMGIYLVFGQHGSPRGGIYIKPPDMPAPPSWLPYARVSSTDEKFKQATAAGAGSALAPMEVPGGDRVAVLIDPSGAAVGLHTTAREVKAPAATARPKATATPKPKAKPKAKAKAKAKVKAKPKKSSPKRKVAVTKARKAARKVLKKVSGRLKKATRKLKRAASKRKQARKARSKK